MDVGHECVKFAETEKRTKICNLFYLLHICVLKLFQLEFILKDVISLT